MKTCSKCREEKSESQFSKKYDKLQSECKDCRAATAKEHYKKNKKTYIARARIRNASANKKNTEIINKLKSVPCADCKMTYPVECMDFDHVRGIKLGNVSYLKTWNNLDKLEQEISKCEVVCANCHRIRTRQRRIAQETAPMPL